MTCYRCNSTQRPVHEMGDDMRVRVVCASCGALAEDAAPKPAPAAIVAAVPKADAPLDVVSLIRARLALVESQIRDVRALEAEAETLRRMLAVVAEPAPLRAVK